MMLSRRHFLALLGAAALARPAQALPKFKGEARPFSRAMLDELAAELSRRRHNPMPQVPEAWRDLTYDQYRALWFDVEKSLFSDTDAPFQVDFFHPGLYFPRPVEINIVDAGQAQTLAFDLSLFKSREIWPDDLPMDDTLGYSGLRLRHPLVRDDRFDEFAVFQGASYFRAIGTGDTYGLSARGLAIDTGEPSGEEFPEFTHFWVEYPRDSETVTVHALLDSPSTTGAYTFHITPGQPCRMAVDCVLYPRQDLAHVGIAPLTSMFLFDATNRTRFDDFRSAVHDSEGLMIHNGAGELLWRPLANPRELQISYFLDDSPRGFGLMQRARRSEDFGDLEALYHNRPSLWITPGEGWGLGSVALVEIPAEKEIYDNIVAYWRPREGLAAGKAHRFSYDMAWGGEPPRPRDVARVLNTRMGKGYDKAKPYSIITIDFTDHPGFHNDGPSDGTLQDTALSDITRFISTNAGEVSEGVLQRNPGTGGVRLAFKFEPPATGAAELRAQLMLNGASVSEVFLYRWTG